jgi:hypothetical protein
MLLWISYNKSLATLLTSAGHLLVFYTLRRTKDEKKRSVLWRNKGMPQDDNSMALRGRPLPPRDFNSGSGFRSLTDF